MAEGADVNEMFQKMGEKLGWFKHKNLDEVKQGLTLSAKKKTKMKNENPETEFGDSKSNGKKTDKLKLKKKKTKVASKQSGKSETVVKQNLPHTKAQSFQILLSSDSDSSLKDIPEHKRRKTSAKAVLQLCSDSDDDDLAPTMNAKGNTDACVKESFIDSVERKYLTGNMTCPKFEPIVNIRPKRESAINCDDTVVKNRVSLASCTLDLDNLGEPLVESTRIHRRSSITYKQIMEDLDSSMEDCKVAENIKKLRKEHQKQADEMLDLETSVCNETNYVTAIETVDDTLNSPELNPCHERSDNRSAFKEQVEEMKETTRNVRIEKKTGSHISKITNQVESDNSESGEEVEVMDTATQTDEVVTADNGGLKQNSESDKKIHRAYKEETILDTHGKVLDFDNRYKATGDIYNEDTVQDSNAHHVDSHSLHQVMDSLKLSDSEREQSSLPVYAEATVNKDKHASTTIGTCIHDYSKETVCHKSNSLSKTDVYNDITGLDNNSDIYDQETNIRDSGHSHCKDVSIVGVNKEIPEASGKMLDEHEEIADGDSIECETKSEAEESIYEVNDAGTQTEEVDQVERINASADEEQKESDQCNVEAGDSEEELKENEQNDCSYNDVHENVNKKEAEFIGKKKIIEDISDESDTSARSQEDISASTSDSGDSSDAISASFARLTEKSGNNKQKKERQKKVDITEQSWRSSRRYSSDLSSDGDLEAFFQKLKKPEQKKSDSSSPLSMDDFIIEDDDMTSESDDSGYYLRETQELENRKDQSPKLQIAALDDDDDDDDESDDFSSKIYPPSVTKHKKKKQAKGNKQSNISWSFSSDSEEETKAKNSKPLKKPKEDNKLKDLKSAKVFKNTKIDLSSDSDTELFNVESFKTDTLGDRKRRVVGNGNGTANTYKSLNSNERNRTGEDIGKMGSANGLSGSVTDEEPLFKTPNPLRKKKNIFEENKENVFKTPTSAKGREPKTPKSISKPVYISLSDTDSDADDSSDFVISISDSSANNKTSGTPSTPLTLKNVTTSRTTPLLLKNGTTPMSATSYPTCTFLKSLSNTTDESRRHPDARRYVNNFKKYKEELSSHLFRLYNQTIFENKLPSDMPVIWNKRLLRTAGYCAYKKNSKDDRDRSTRIELSVKVCDNAERVRDTLIHEMCHAAVWLLNGVNGGHGSYWKYWARHATRIHQELPAVSVCHSYSINTKFTYRCKKCGYSIGRHSKSLDVKKKVCGYCRGEFELIQNSVPTTPTSAVSSASSTPKQPNKFALFVKDNYNSVKRQNKDLKHGDVMKELSKLFAESKITS